MSKDFAVIRLNSKQYIVNPDSTLKADHVLSTEFDVLAAEVGGKTYIGEPVVKEVGVKLLIEEDKKDLKIKVYRFRNKSRYRKNTGHRQPVSIVKVLEIGKNVKNSIKRAESAETKSSSVKDLDITDTMKENLLAAGYKTIADINSAKKEDLLAIKGFGNKAYDKLVDAIKHGA